MYNVGSFFRTGDGAGIERLLLSGITARPPEKALFRRPLSGPKIAWRGKQSTILLQWSGSCRRKTYEIAAIETSPQAMDIF